MASSSESDALVRVERLEVDGGETRDVPDLVACEEPLEIQLEADSLAVVMRTPGHDAELALGFLLTERVVERAEQVISVHPYFRNRNSEGDDNVIRVVLGADVEVDRESLRRNLFASSSCGVCGKATIENAMRTAAPLDDPSRFARGFFTRLPAALREGQTGFDQTGGLHAAALFSPEGRRLVLREDVGRHNAVDKVVGWALREGRTPLSAHTLMVSGRISFEIVQKALAARIPVIAAVSAPTSLAVALAEASGITLVAFLRGPRFAVYGLRERIVG